MARKLAPGLSPVGIQALVGYAGSNHLLTDQVESVIDGLIQIHRRRCLLGIAAEPPELIDDVACLIKGSSCALGPGQQKFPIHILAAFEMTLDVVAGELDGRQGLIDLMGHRCGQLTQ